MSQAYFCPKLLTLLMRCWQAKACPTNAARGPQTAFWESTCALGSNRALAGPIRGPYFSAYALSARVPLDPLLANEISFIHSAQAGVRVVPSGDPRTWRSAPPGYLPRRPIPIMGSGTGGGGGGTSSSTGILGLRLRISLMNSSRALAYFGVPGLGSMVAHSSGVISWTVRTYFWKWLRSRSCTGFRAEW